MEQKIKKLPGIVLGARAEHRQILLLQRPLRHRLRKLRRHRSGSGKDHQSPHRLIEPVHGVDAGAELLCQKRRQRIGRFSLRAYADRLNADNKSRRLF